MRNNLVFIEGSNFIFNTNFSGDPKRDRFGSDQRKGNLIIPDVEQARMLIDEGFNVKLTKPKEGEEEGFIPRYFISVKVNYDSKWPPKVYLVTDVNDGVLLDEESIECIDDMWVESVNAVLNPYEGPNGKSLYVKSMEVFQKIDDDPIAARYSKRNIAMGAEEEDAIPFN
ncbi:MAG: hypothetical protein KH921_07065 [Erysipelotrichaceae bacterium]|nr:hypothetical protein [Erysipelotrichaceae bacterium]